MHLWDLTEKLTLFQAPHQEQIRQITLKGGSTSFSIRRQGQRPEKLRSWLRNLNRQPRLFAARCNLETADLDAARFALLQEQISAITAPARDTLSVLQVNDGFGISATDR